VGADSHDDAAVYRLDEHRALVFTVDIITPIVDDPETFGRVAANNSLSDVFAMGARPLMALNVSCLPTQLPATAAREILRGAEAAALEAGCPILGGHSVKDSEVKFGLAVVGEVDPEKVVRNDSAQDQDALILTKRLGTAALATAFKAGSFDESDPRYASLVEALTLSNRRAMEIALRHDVHAATDVTGFGLAGHLLEMLASNGLGAQVRMDHVHALPGALDAIEAGFVCGGANSNADFTGDRIRAAKNLPPNQLGLLQDPQTAGPLLLAVEAPRAGALLDELRAAGYPQAVQIGEFTHRNGGIVEVV